MASESLEVATSRVGSAQACPALAPFVRAFYEETLTVPHGRFARVPISATAHPFLLTAFSGECTVELEGEHSVRPALLIGPQPRAYALSVSGAATIFHVEFAPTGPLALLGVEGYGGVRRGAAPLAEVVRAGLRGDVRKWVGALRRAPSFSARAEVANGFLKSHLPRVEPRLAFLRAAIAAIEDASGNLRVDCLARALGASPSTLRRHFRVLGISPKQFSEVVRFRHAHNFLRTAPRATPMGVVERFGFCDQPHFVRDYHRFSGAPPTQWDEGVRVVDRQMGLV